MSDEQRSLAEIVFGGILFIISEIAGLVPEAYHIYCLVAAYILLGGRIVLTALKNSTKGQVFDENFLMTVATLGALLSINMKKLLELCCFIVSENILSIVRLKKVVVRLWKLSICVRK